MIRSLVAVAVVAVMGTPSFSGDRIPADTTATSVARDTTLTNPSGLEPVVSQQIQTTVPFKVGERADYDVRFGFLKVGKATMSVAGIEKVRGRDTWHTVFRLEGGTIGFRVKDIFESWIDRETFSSLRFHSTLSEGPNDRSRRYEIYPDKAIYVETDKKPPREHKSVKDPLDDGSFLFFIRSVPLEVGKTYEFHRYFRPDRNPVTIKVLRKETIEVPAGKFNCIVVQPIIKTKGIFSEDGKAEVWLTDDHRRVVVQLKSKLSFGSINLYLKSYKEGAK